MPLRTDGPTLIIEKPIKDIRIHVKGFVICFQKLYSLNHLVRITHPWFLYDFFLKSYFSFLLLMDVVIIVKWHFRDAVGKETTVNIDVNGEKFVAHGLTVIAKNYLEVKTIYSNEKHISRDKTMDDKMMYIDNNYNHNYPFCRFKILVEKFETNLSKFNKRTQSLKLTNEKTWL